ncbi:MAG: substrate-binding domain-containing protein [Luteolibacter sp.]
MLKENDNFGSAAPAALAIPSRGNLVLDCVRVMRMRIASGEWIETVPGERRLAEILHVGRDTVRLALQQMEREGLLAPSDIGNRRRKILHVPLARKAEAVRPLKIGLLVHRPLDQLSQPELLEIYRIRVLLADKSGSLEVYSPGWYNEKNPAKRLEELVTEERCDAWILMRSSEAVQQWFVERRVPGLIRGCPYPGVDLPHLDVDWRATARHAAGQLWRLGHRRVIVMTPTEALNGEEAAVSGVMDLGEPDFEVSVVTEDGTPGSIACGLARALNYKTPPTAVIATCPRQAATALTWLSSQGIRVPHHISLITLAWEPFLGYLVPEVVSYQISPESVAKLVVKRLERLLDGDPNPVENRWIMPKAAGGTSIGKV